jgi:hypothetical protein
MTGVFAISPVPPLFCSVLMAYMAYLFLRLSTITIIIFVDTCCGGGNVMEIMNANTKKRVMAKVKRMLDRYGEEVVSWCGFEQRMAQIVEHEDDIMDYISDMLDQSYEDGFESGAGAQKAVGAA